MTSRLAAHILENGFEQTSLRNLADAAGVSDRMLLYYFTNKNDLLSSIILKIAAEMAVILAGAIPEVPKLSPLELFQQGAKLTMGTQLRPYMKVSIEISARAGRGEIPFAQLSQGMIDGFRIWIEARLETQDLERRRMEALMLLAMIDGLGVLSFAIDEDDLMKAMNALERTLAR